MIATLLLIVRLLLAVLLYAFLGWALWIILKDLQRQAGLASAQKAPGLALTQINESGSQVRRFGNAELLIGRENNCDLILSDSTVSAQHARLAYHHNQWWVEDLISTNGTYLNETPVNASVALTSGDRLRCGKVELVIEILS